MSIRWIRNINIDGEASTIEIQIGYTKIGDRCYTRVGKDIEIYFAAVVDEREGILIQGVDLLQQQLANRSVTKESGESYDWR
jgi:hypothetical protein